jgi:alanine racemase
MSIYKWKIWDNEHITLEEIAGKCDAINYEIVCTIGKRIKRKYCNS